MTGRRARVEGGARRVAPVTDKIASEFEKAIAGFKELFPDEWESLRLCPLQHGLDAIAEKLKG